MLNKNIEACQSNINKNTQISTNIYNNNDNKDDKLDIFQMLDRIQAKALGLPPPPEPECHCDKKGVYYSKVENRWLHCDACNPRKKCTRCMGSGIQTFDDNTAFPYCVCHDTKSIANRFNEAGFSKQMLDQAGFIDKLPAPFYPVEDKDSNIAKKLIHDYPATDKHFMVIHGESGCGKTTQVAYLARDLIFNNKSVIIVNFEKVLDEIYDRSRDNPASEIINKYVAPDYLVIDALDKEHMRSTKFKSLLIKRDDANKKTIITTHLSQGELAKCIGNEMLQKRINRSIVTVDYKSNSYVTVKTITHGRV